MTRRRPALLAAGLLLLSTSALAAGASADPKPRSGSESRTYTASPSGGVDCGTSTGGACFALPADLHAIGLVVNDGDGFRGIAVDYRFLDADGALLSAGTACDTGRALAPRDAVTLEVEVAAVDTSSCEQPSVSRGGKMTVTYDLKRGQGEPPLDGERPCNAFLGEPVSYALAPDDGLPVGLDVLVLQDGVTTEAAQQIMGKVVDTFARVGVTVRPTYQDVALTSGPAVDALFKEMRALLGGQVPPEYDVVHALTQKDIAGAAGYADCVGGSRSPKRAFSISEAVPGKVPNLIAGQPMPVWPWEQEAYFAAHEIGHLLGGNHDFANCVEGALLVDDDTPAPCTLMYPYLNITFQFSTLNQAVVRGYARDTAED